MKSEIKVIPNSSTKGKENFEKGNCFEVLIRNIIEAQHYIVDPNVQFTGLEIDLVAKHKYDNNSTLYVECKAKEKVKSTEIKNFGYNFLVKKPSKAYFIYTQELDKQASGLKNEDFSNKEEFENVTFYGPDKIIQLLIDEDKIKAIDIEKNENITQQILLITYKGDYNVFIGNENLAYPTHYFIYKAGSGVPLNTEEDILDLLDEIPEIQALEFRPITRNSIPSEVSQQIKEDFEIVAEVQAGEEWFDYKPASSSIFIGREKLKSDIFNFFNKVIKEETNNRAFYLKGNSGWGKSSLVNAISGTCRNKYYKKRFFSVAYDCRSASTENFVAKAFQKAIEKSIRCGFIEKPQNLASEIKFTSNYNLLDSEYLLHYCNELKNSGKVLIVIFDQFEDVFRKTDIFKYFYKFLSDVNEYEFNIIVGFSWKSEFLIQPDNESYSWFQQAKDQSVEFNVPEFGIKETNGIIKQLEDSLNNSITDFEGINNELRTRLTENSQGFPWLVKKLCIHVYNQILSGKKQDDLIDENLNIESLFKADLSGIVENEQKALELIAHKAVNGDLFDETDTVEYQLSAEVKSLIDKRLIIRSGYNYNVYWDNFRDYIVNKKVPQIRRGYLFKQGAQPCLRVFLTFSKKRKQSFVELHKNLNSSLGEGTLANILIELRNFELVKKVQGQDVFYIPDSIDITEESFIELIKAKVLEFSTFSRLTELKTKRIEIPDITKVLKDIFKSVSHKEKTWNTYSNYYANWIKYLKLDIGKRISVPQKGQKLKDFDKDNASLFLRSNPVKAYSFFKSLITTNFIITSKNKDFIRDFRVLKLIHLNKSTLTLTSLGQDFDKYESEALFNIKLCAISKSLKKINDVCEIYDETKIGANELVTLHPSIIGNSKSEKTQLVYASKLLSWARFILKNEKNKV